MRAAASNFHEFWGSSGSSHRNSTSNEQLIVQYQQYSVYRVQGVEGSPSGPEHTPERRAQWQIQYPESSEHRAVGAPGSLTKAQSAVPDIYIYIYMCVCVCLCM